MTVMFTRGENPLKADKLNSAFSERVARSGDTMQGRLNLFADPVAPFEAATKQYVDRFTSVGVPTGAYIGAAPPGNVLAPLWWDTNTGQLFIQYNDGSSTQWVSANSIDASSLAGSFLPLTGGSLSGPLLLAADPATALGAATKQYVDGHAPGSGIVVPPGGSIQAAHDALPATGGMIMLSSNTTYMATSTINITKPNVRLSAPSWATVLKRDPAFTAALILVTGARSVIEGFTVDGSSVVGTHWEVQVWTGADNSLVRNMRFINSAGSVNLGLCGQYSRATGNTIIGLGASLSTERGYGIWAINHNTVMIDHNTIIGTGIDGIGFDGEGSQVIGNRLTGCHCWTGGQGGQIASYFGLGGGVGAGQAIVGNTIGPPGASTGSGIEAWNPGMAITGNSINGIPGAAITIFGSGTTVVGNSIRNCGGTADAVVVVGGVSDFAVVGNRIADVQTTPTMRYGVSIYPGASDRYVITNNLISGNTSNAVRSLEATGTNRLITNNLGNNDNGMPIAGGTLTGNLAVAGGTLTVGADGITSSILNLDAVGSGSIRKIQIQTNSGQRWQIGAANNETGSGNAGTDLFINAYSDANAFLSQPLLITRATGMTTIGAGLRVNGSIGFNTAPVAKPSVTGSRAGNAALASLLTALASYGLVTDGSTA